MNKRHYEVTDPRGYRIRLYDQRFDLHIRDSHDKTDIEIVLTVLEHVEFITEDVNYFPSTENYYKSDVLDDDPDAYIKVCVKVEGNRRSVITAFDAEPRRRENVIWRQ